MLPLQSHSPSATPKTVSSKESQSTASKTPSLSSSGSVALHIPSPSVSASPGQGNVDINKQLSLAIE